MVERSVVALVCPTCGSDLSGLDTDMVFGCRSCATAWEPTIEGLAGPYPLLQTEHSSDGAEVTLPFWRFAVAPLLLPEGVSSPTFAYVSAFDVRRRKYFGDPGLRWTLSGSHLDGGAPRADLLGATLSPRDAETLAHFTVLRAIDVQRDVTGFEFDLQLESPSVILVTFADRDNALVDPVNGESYGAAAFCDLPMLRDAAR